MKVGIITFHFVSNQGAILQCYALQTLLQRMGHDVRIIDYRPKYHTIRYSAWKNPFLYARWYWKRYHKHIFARRFYLSVRSFVRCLGMNLQGTDREIERLINSFINNNLHLTEQYTSLKQLQANPPEMDAYISGSDQLWNTELLDQEFDRAYFLDFGKPEIKRITYAVSVGKTPAEKELLQLNDLCRDLDAISLREYDEATIKAIGRDVHICIDPTLLLDEKDYSAIESNNIASEPYIFVYGFETNDAILSAVDMAVKKYRCRVINGSPTRIKLPEEVDEIRNYAPDHFLTLVKNADCVVTNSFHGTAFSIIYKKKFITVPHSTRGNRMIELLGKLGLNYCLWGSKEFSFEREIDYTATYNKLQMLRDDSIKYLTDALNGKSGETTKCNSGWMQTSNNEASVTEEYSGLQAYSGYYYDDNILKQSASGGAADVLARQVLEENGVVFGVAYSENFKSAGYICIESPDDLHLIRGSKYIVPNKQILIEGKYYSIYEVIEQKLKQNKKVLFIGLGCDVGAVKKYLEVNSIDDSNLYTIDLICHGPTFQAVQEDYINALEKKFASKIVEFSMRYKKKEWTPPYVYAAFANGKKYYKPFYETDLGYAFKVYSRKACFNCKYKGHNHIADLTVGDYWGLKPGMVGYNPKGVSIILSRTEKGSHMISQINKDRFALERTDLTFAIQNNRMFSESRSKPWYYESFEKDFKEHGLHYAVKRSPGYRVYKKTALKRRLRSLAALLFPKKFGS